jgi:hypothetical protein
MIVMHSYWERSSFPNYYAPAVEMMRKANGMAFSTYDDFKRFCGLLRETLAAHRPAGSRACIGVVQGQVSIQPDHGLGTDVARISHFRLGGVLAWNAQAGDFFDVTDEVREGGEA